MLSYALDKKDKLESDSREVREGLLDIEVY
jgi:hypothetical protein